MTKLDFLQGLKTELEGSVPYSVIHDNLNYYDHYITQETEKGRTEAEVIEELGGPRIIARTILDAAYDSEDRPDGYENGAAGAVYEEDGSESRSYEEKQAQHRIHLIDFGKWYVRVLAGLAVCAVIFLLITVFFSIIGLAGWVLSWAWPILLILMIIWMFRGPGRRF